MANIYSQMKNADLLHEFEQTVYRVASGSSDEREKLTALREELTWRLPLERGRRGR